MTFYQSLAVVLLRVWAAVFLAEWLSYLISWAIGWFTQDFWADEQSRLYYLTNLAIYAISFLIGVVVWFSAPALGKRVGGGFPDPAPNLGIDGERLVAIGAFLIGLFYIVEYGPKSATNVVQAFYQYGKLTDGERLSGGQGFSFVAWENIAATWLVFAVAILVAFRARDIGKLFAWLRQAGQYREKSETGDAPGKSVAGE